MKERGASTSELPPSDDQPATDTYSSAFAVAYIFNLIVGVGALSLPKAFSDAGIILGTILLFVLAFTSYMTATYMIEAMAIANAYVKCLKRKKEKLVNSMTVQSKEYLQSGSSISRREEPYKIKSRSPTPSRTVDPEKERLIPPILSEDLLPICPKQGMNSLEYELLQEHNKVFTFLSQLAKTVRL